MTIPYLILNESKLMFFSDHTIINNTVKTKQIHVLLIKKYPPSMVWTLSFNCFKLHIQLITNINFAPCSLKDIIDLARSNMSCELYCVYAPNFSRTAFEYNYVPMNH